MLQTVLVTIAIVVVAVMYSTVGHGGASGYIAVLTIAGYDVSVIRPTALILNIIVASIGTVQFYRAGHLSWQRVLPYAIASGPASFVGGAIHVPTQLIHLLIGSILVLSAIRLCIPIKEPDEYSTPHWSVSFGVGAVIGLLSGLTGTGGGIFLTPLLLICRWANAKQAAGISVCFILLNSISGLGGHLYAGRSIPLLALWLAAPVIVGGSLGAHLGSRKLSARGITFVLVIVLLIAGVKLIYTA